MDNESRLEDIANATGVKLGELQDSYEWKALDYRYRDLKRGVCASDAVYYDRAISVIQGYYTRKHAYTENWIE